MKTIVISLLLALPPLQFAWSSTGNPIADAIQAQTKYAPLLLKVKGVYSLTTSICNPQTQKLETDWNYAWPVYVCVGVKVKSTEDLARIQALFESPLILDNVQFDFTDRDPIPHRAGVTVHN